MINDTSSETHLLQFISDNYLKRPNGIVLFDALISYRQDEKLKQVSSEIQIITLPHSMALYVLAFFNDKCEKPEFYNTKECIFKYNGKSKIEIHLKDNAGLVLSVELLQKD